MQHIFDYTATFEDGSQIAYDRNTEDLPQIAETGNRYSDVVATEKEKKLVSFVLHNEEHSFGVDLRDGHFEIDGVVFFQHRPDREFYKDFRLIYFRTMSQEIHAMTGKVVGSSIESYTIGWQTTTKKNGKEENIQRIISF